MQVLGIWNASSGEPVLAEKLSVADVQDILGRQGHQLAYTTVMTVLTRLFEKGLLERRKEKRSFLYYPSKAAPMVARNLIARVQNFLFGNEKLRPIIALLQADDSLTVEDLRELRRAVDDRLEQETRKDDRARNRKNGGGGVDSI